MSDRRLADANLAEVGAEQAALRRIAALLARSVPAEEVFDAVVGDGHLLISVRDDGIGGADPACGSGLVGLKDRIEAFGGTMTLNSPTGGGTTLVAQFPLPEPVPVT